jgi:RNA polymerase sigma-70 factor (ECF subfamily)
MNIRGEEVGSSKSSLEPSARDVELGRLISSIAAGDQSALAELYDRSSRVAFGLILRVLGDPSMAEEVTLDVYTQVWRQAKTYDSARGTPLAWLLTIARTRAIDRLRSGKQERQRSESLDSADAVKASGNPEESSVLSEQQRIVQGALAGLSADQREVIELAYFQGLSQSEIASTLGQPLGTVKTRTRLGLIKLRETLGPILRGAYGA